MTQYGFSTDAVNYVARVHLATCDYLPYHRRAELFATLDAARQAANALDFEPCIQLCQPCSLRMQRPVHGGRCLCFPPRDHQDAQPAPPLLSTTYPFDPGDTV